MRISGLPVKARADLDYIYEQGRELALSKERLWNPSDRYTLLTGVVSVAYFPATERLQTHLIDEDRIAVQKGESFEAEVDRYLLVRPQQDDVSMGERIARRGKRRGTAYPLSAARDIDKVTIFLSRFREDFTTGRELPQSSRNVIYQPWG